MKKTVRTSLKRIISIFLVSIMLLGSVVPIFATEGQENVPQTISDGIYMLKNKHTEKYLTLPGYFEYTSGKNNVYQDISTINDQYSRAVRVTYTTSGYTITPLLYENFGGGYVSVEENGNVVVSSTETKWKIEYNNTHDVYKILCEDKLLGVLGQANGSVDEKGISTSGNIITADNCMAFWEFEPITVNPHIFKRSSVTKKNIGIDNEWLFKLSDSEMNNCSITDCIVSGNTNLVQVARSGNYVVVKINNDLDSDKSNDFAIITITVRNNNGSHKRTIVVQNSGTGHGDACTTKTFKGTTPIHEIVLEPNQSKDILLAFHSSAGSFVAETWKSTDSCVTLAECEEKLITGTNFAVAKVNEVGLSCIEVTDAQGNCLRMIINVISSDTTQTQSSIINVTLDTTSLVLDANRGYLLRVPSSLEPTSWHFSPSSNVGYMYMWDNYIYMNTYSDDVDSAFIDSGYNSMTLTVVGAGRLEIELNVRQESKGRFEFGMGGDIYVGVGQTVKLVPEYTAYAYTSEDSFVAEVDSCGNVTALSTGSTIITAKSRYDLEAPDYSIYINVVLNNDLYYIENAERKTNMQPKDGSANPDKIIELEDFNKSSEAQKWSLVYKGEGYYNIINEYSCLALSVKEGEETTTNKSLIQAVPDTSDRQLWYIQGLGNNKYMVSSKASEQSDSYLVMASDDGVFSKKDVEQHPYANNDYCKWKFELVTPKAFVYSSGIFEAQKWVDEISPELNSVYGYSVVQIVEDAYSKYSIMDYVSNSEFAIISGHGSANGIKCWDDENHSSAETAILFEYSYISKESIVETNSLNNVELVILLSCETAEGTIKNSNSILLSSDIVLQSDGYAKNLFEQFVYCGVKNVIAFDKMVHNEDASWFIEDFMKFWSQGYTAEECMGMIDFTSPKYKSSDTYAGLYSEEYTLGDCWVLGVNEVE